VELWKGPALCFSPAPAAAPGAGGPAAVQGGQLGGAAERGFALSVLQAELSGAELLGRIQRPFCHGDVQLGVARTGDNGGGGSQVSLSQLCHCTFCCGLEADTQERKIPFLSC